MGTVQTFETTIVKRDIGESAEAFVMPAHSIDAMPTRSRDVSDLLGLQVGVRVPSPDLLPTVFFATMAGRIRQFDEGSFERWQRQMESTDPRVVFARELSFERLLPVESSPLEKVSLGALAERAPAYVIASTEAWDHPVAALGIVVAGEFGVVVVNIIREAGKSAAEAARYHTRRLLKVPEDWTPPKDPH